MSNETFRTRKSTSQEVVDEPILPIFLRERLGHLRPDRQSLTNFLLRFCIGALSLLLLQLATKLVGVYVTYAGGLFVDVAMDQLGGNLIFNWLAFMIGLAVIAGGSLIWLVPRGWRASLSGALFAFIVLTAMEADGEPLPVLPLWVGFLIALLIIGLTFLVLRQSARSEGVALSTLWGRSRVAWMAIATGLPVALGAQALQTTNGAVQAIEYVSGGVSALAGGFDEDGAQRIAIASYDGELVMLDPDAPYYRREHRFDDGRPVTKLIWMANPLLPREPGEPDIDFDVLPIEQQTELIDQARQRLGLIDEDGGEISAYALRAFGKLYDRSAIGADCFSYIAGTASSECQTLQNALPPISANISVVYETDVAVTAPSRGNSPAERNSDTLASWIPRLSLGNVPFGFRDPERTEAEKASSTRMIAPGVIAVREGEVLWWDGSLDLDPVILWQGAGFPIVSVDHESRIHIIYEAVETGDELTDTLFDEVTGSARYVRVDPLLPRSPYTDSAADYGAWKNISASAQITVEDEQDNLALYALIIGYTDGRIGDRTQKTMPLGAGRGSSVIKIEPVGTGEFLSWHANGAVTRWAYQMPEGEASAAFTVVASFSAIEAGQVYGYETPFLKPGLEDKTGRLSLARLGPSPDGIDVLAELAGFAEPPAETLILPKGEVVLGSWEGEVVLADQKMLRDLHRIAPGRHARSLRNGVGAWFSGLFSGADDVETDPFESLEALRSLTPQARAIAGLQLEEEGPVLTRQPRFVLGSIVAMPNSSQRIQQLGLDRDEAAVRASPEATTDAILDTFIPYGLAGAVDRRLDGSSLVSIGAEDDEDGTELLSGLGVSDGDVCPDDLQPEELQNNPELSTLCLARHLSDSGEYEYVELDWVFELQEEAPSREPDGDDIQVFEDPRRTLHVSEQVNLWQAQNALPEASLRTARLSNTPMLAGRAQAEDKPFLPLQWSLAGGWAGGAHYDAVWTTESGQGREEVTIALIDTGIDFSANLVDRERFYDGWDFVSDVEMANDGDGRDNDPSDPGDACLETDEPSWHGTATASLIIGSAGRNGLSGAQSNVRLLPVRAVGRCGARLSDINHALRWSAGLMPEYDNLGNEVWTETPATLVNLPVALALGSCPASLQDAINDVRASGALVIVPAGNWGLDTAFVAPANCDGVTVVAASDARGHLTAYSGRGDEVDVLAPGGDLSRDDTGEGQADGILVAKSSRDCIDPITQEEIFSCDLAWEQGTSYAVAHATASFAYILSERDRVASEYFQTVPSALCTRPCYESAGGRPIDEAGAMCTYRCGRRLDMTRGEATQSLPTLAVTRFLDGGSSSDEASNADGQNYVAVSGEPIPEGAFTYYAPGDLTPGSGTGSSDDTLYAPDMVFPVRDEPVFLNTQVWNYGGGLSGGTQCDPRRFQYPWRDNYCETRSTERELPFCPSNRGHSGVDLFAGDAELCERMRTAAPADRTFIEVVAAEDGLISNIGSYSLNLRAGSRIYRYYHLNMQALQVELGQAVEAGDLIGYLSSDFGGNATTFHLHMELRVNLDDQGWANVPLYSSLVAAYERQIGEQGIAVRDLATSSRVYEPPSESSSDRDAQPLVRIPAQYPERCDATAAFTESVTIEFDVTPDGNVTNAQIIDTTNNCFDREATRAVQRWKYQPKIIDGQQVWRRGVQTVISFENEFADASEDSESYETAE